MATVAEKRKRVLQIITQHADVMTGPQLDKALDVWDGLVKSEINKPLPVAPNRKKGNSQDNKKEKPVETITKSQKAEKPRTRWGTMPSLADIASRNEHARTVATPPAKPFVPTDFKSGKMTIHEQQEYRLQQAREKEAARQKKSAVSGASVTACRL